MNFLKQNSGLSWWNMTSVQIGGAICLPILMVGEQLGRIYGLFYSVYSIFLGNILLCGMALIMAYMSFENKKTTVENAYTFFGSFGTYLLAIAMIIGLIGWFTIQLHVVSGSIIHFIELCGGYAISITLMNYLLVFLMVCCARSGISGLIWLSDITMPLLLGMIGYTVYRSYMYEVIGTQPTIVSFGGLSLVLATAIMAVLDIPTYYRLAASKKDSFISIIILFLVVLPLIELAGVYISICSDSTDIVSVFAGNGTVWWQICVTLFFLCAGWTTNNANLYSATIAAQELFPHCSYQTRLYILGFIAMILSSVVGVIPFECLLNAMGIIVSALGGVIIMGYIWLCLISTHIHALFCAGNIAVSVGGIIIGFSSLFHIFSITGLPLIDAFFSTASLFIIVQTTLCMIQKVYR